MSKLPFYIASTGEFETEIDDVNWLEARKVAVEYSYTADAIEDITVRDLVSNEKLTLTAEQEKDLIEEIWNDVRQMEDYA